MRINDITLFNNERTVPYIDIDINGPGPGPLALGGEYARLMVGPVKMFFHDRIDLINFKNELNVKIDKAISDSIGG